MLARLALYLYGALIRVAAWGGNRKAQLWVAGRKSQNVPRYTASDKVVWLHCASLGEFEQGRPVLEALVAADPTITPVLTFFSPSGYEVRKNYTGAAWVGYLPLDVGRKAKQFIEAIQPRLALFVKYDLYPGYLQALKAHGIPAVLFASNFRKGTAKVALYNQLRLVFVQADANKSALAAAVPRVKTHVAGDPRFDRVSALVERAEPVPEVETWLGGAPCLVAGSTWPKDAALIAKALPQAPDWKLVLVPHEVQGTGFEQQLAVFPGAHRWSAGPPPPGAQVLVVDTVGLLGRLYQHGTLSYVGGGFGKGIHNTLEAAVWGRPLLFGPRYRRFREAVGLIAAGAAVSLANTGPLAAWLHEADLQTERYLHACTAARTYVAQHTGATARIVQGLENEGLWPLA